MSRTAPRPMIAPRRLARPPAWYRWRVALLLAGGAALALLLIWS